METGELKELVAAALERRGVLAELRASVRANVFLAVEERAKAGFKGATRKSPAARRLAAAVETPRGALAAAIVREFLTWGGLGHTAEVLAAEAQLPEGEAQPTRAGIASECGVDGSDEAQPILVTVLGALLDADVPRGTAGPAVSADDATDDSIEDEFEDTVEEPFSDSADDDQQQEQEQALQQEAARGPAQDASDGRAPKTSAGLLGALPDVKGRASKGGLAPLTSLAPLGGKPTPLAPLGVTPLGGKPLDAPSLGSSAPAGGPQSPSEGPTGEAADVDAQAALPSGGGVGDGSGDAEEGEGSDEVAIGFDSAGAADEVQSESIIEEDFSQGSYSGDSEGMSGGMGALSMDMVGSHMSASDRSGEIDDADFIESVDAETDDSDEFEAESDMLEMPDLPGL